MSPTYQSPIAKRRHAQAVSAGPLVSAWAASPSRFARDVFGIEPWAHESGPDAEGSSQVDVLDSIPFNSSIAWRSGHKVGKSTAAAIAALWFFALRPGARVVLTAPTARQIREVVWREVRRLWIAANRRGMALGGHCGETYSAGIIGPEGRQVIGLSTDEGDKFSGVSGDVFYVLDEASGVEDRIWEAVEGNRAGGAKLFAIGNPTRPEGAFHRAFHEEASLWATHWTPSESTPTARGTRHIPHLAEPEWISGRRIAWAPHMSNPLYQVRVRGEFPTGGANAVLDLGALTAAMQRVAEPDLDLPLIVGVDVARFGDDQNALIARRGRVVVRVHTWGGLDLVSSASFIRAQVSDLMTPAERAGHTRRPVVYIDSIGVGAGVADILARAHELDAVGVNVALPPDDGEAEEQYANLRAQLWFGMAEWMASGSLPNDPRLRADLLAPRYVYDTRGRLKVEEKALIKKRIGRSPDLGDALSLCCYGGGNRWTASDAERLDEAVSDVFGGSAAGRLGRAM